MHYHPELNGKVDKMVAMAPEGTLAYTKSILIRLTAAFLNPLMVIMITKYISFNSFLSRKYGLYNYV